MVAFLGASGLTANGATAGGWLAVFAYAWALHAGLSGARLVLWLVPGLALVRLAFNALDGMLARAQGTATAAGELWNEAGDILGDTICYGVLFFVPGAPSLSLTFFLVATWAAEFFGVLGKSLPGGTRRHESLGGGKPERAIWISLFALFCSFNPAAVSFLPAYLVAVGILVSLTAAWRARKSLKAAAGKPYHSYTAFGV